MLQKLDFAVVTLVNSIRHGSGSSDKTYCVVLAVINKLEGHKIVQVVVVICGIRVLHVLKKLLQSKV